MADFHNRDQDQDAQLGIANGPVVIGLELPIFGYGIQNEARNISHHTFFYTDGLKQKHNHLDVMPSTRPHRGFYS